MNVIKFNFYFQNIEPELLFIVGISILIIGYQILKVALHFMSKN